MGADELLHLAGLGYGVVVLVLREVGGVELSEDLQTETPVDVAKKANNIRTWKDINEACLAAEEYKLAQTCALYIIAAPDHLDSLIAAYEKRGLYEELMKILEQGLGLENAHAGIFTELAVLYTKYAEDKTMDHLKIHWNRVQSAKVIRACENARLWYEAFFMYKQSNDFDMAVRTMIDHSAVAWKEDDFFEVIPKVNNKELNYLLKIFLNHR